MIVEKIYNRNVVYHNLVLFRNTGRATKISFENILNGKIVVTKEFMRASTDIMLIDILTNDTHYLNFHRTKHSVYSVNFTEEERAILVLLGASL